MTRKFNIGRQNDIALNKEILIPKLLFYIDCNNVIKIVSGGKNYNYIYEKVNEENK